jgi:hypothetical protein
MVTQVVTAEGAGGQVRSASRPYAPSWVDAIVDGIDRLPGPTWAAYVGIALFASLFIALEATLSSRGLFGQTPLYFGYAVVMVAPLAVYHFLSRGAGTAWDAFRPATNLDDAAAGHWRVELTTTPARPAAVVYAASVVGYLLALAAAPNGFDLVGHQPAFIALRVISEAFWMAPVAWMVVYLLFRQMRIVSELHRAVARVDLLQPGPLHAMARLTARSAIVLLALMMVSFIPLPNVSEDARLLLRLVVAPFLIVPVAAFFLPLRGMHALLDAEKVRRQAEVSTRIDATTTALHAMVDEETAIGTTRDAEASQLAQVRIDSLNMAQASLLQEREFVGKLSSWPWDVTTFRAVVSALALPLVLFVLTTAIDRVLL